jgi:hypothetical protein
VSEPYDLAAEQALLGSVLSGSELAGKVLADLPPDAFWHPRHQVIAAVLCERLRRQEPIDATLTLADLASRSGAGKGGSGRSEDGPYLLQLIELAWSPGHAEQYGERLRQLTAARRIQVRITRAGQLTDLSLLNPDGLTAAVAELRTACDDVDDVLVPTALTPSRSLAELLAEPVRHDWLVPGLLERSERFLLTGGEGGGKSYLTSQIAACLAAGLHPFTGNLLGSGRRHLQVLVIDGENSRNQTFRRYQRIARVVDDLRSRGPEMRWRENLRLEFRPEGLDLLGRDAGWTERIVAANQPDLLVIGPLYKLHHANINDEQAARDLLYFLDTIRTRYGCALLTESHPGHAENVRGERKMRPAGSSLFLRWPEFGYGLARSKNAVGEHPDMVDVIAWRGSREERAWPKQLHHGHPDLLPWLPSDPHYGADADYLETA